MKTAFVTGGSRGIGAATVRELSKRGYSVAFTYLNSKAEAMSLSSECSALALRADMALPQDVKDAVGRAQKELGHIDLLVNNAGISQIKMFNDISEDDWQRMLSVNLGGAYRASRAVLDKMISRKSGCIINISSIWGVTGASCEVHYSASKAALIGFTRALAKELGPSGIRVNCIAPGVIDTDMNSSLDENTKEELCDETPLCRIGTADEIAKAVCFLASDDASFITGQILGVNGGIVI
jgi:3-oxoacyl-[acyl-carrier protein] reductase